MTLWDKEVCRSKKVSCKELEYHLKNNTKGYYQDITEQQSKKR